MLLFLDGVAHYDTSRIGMKYSAINSNYCDWSVAAEGRFGNCVKRQSTSNNGQAGYLDIAPLMTRLGAWTPTVSGVCGFAVKVNDLAYVAADIPGPSPFGFFVILEGGSHHLTVRLNPSGTFSLAAGTFSGPANILAESGEGLASNVWMYVEFKWLLHASAGTFEIRVNGVTVLTYSGATLGSAVTGALNIWSAVRLLSVPSTVLPGPTVFPLLIRLCDLYLADLASADPDDVSDFLGDGTIATIRPNAVGTWNGWTPTGATANWDAVNDRALPDDETTYVATTGAGTNDTYNYEDIPASSIVKGTQWVALLRKETEGASMVKPIVRQGSTDYLGPAQGVASTGYDRYLTQPYDLNPATGDKFTAGQVNAGQFGIQKSS